MKKRILSAILALVLMLSLVPLTASAVEPNKCGDKLTYTLDGDTLTISGTGSMYNYDSALPPWHSNRSSISKVVIKEGVTSIGNNAFRDCSNLSSITIPSSVTTIGNYGFSCCESLKTIAIPETVTSLGVGAFSESGLTSVIIPGSITSIPKMAFYWCGKLTSVTISKGVNSIGNNAFNMCDSLTSVTIPDSVTSIGDYAFYQCDSLTSVTIPDSVTSLGEGAFCECDSLTSVTIPDSVTSIGECAFIGCSKLATVVFQGDGITVSDAIFANSVTAYYPHGNTTWTETVRNPYGNRVTWQEGCVKSGLDKLSYEQVDIPEVPATCTEPGWVGGKKCSRCGDILVPQEKTDLAEHDYELSETKEATCTKRAHDIYECSDCHRTKVEYYGVLAEHTAVTVPEVPATCAEAGHKAGTKCSVCGKTLSGCEVISAKKHAAVSAVDGSKASLTASGVKAHYECDDCGGCFADKECTQPVSPESCTIPAVKSAKLSSTSYTYNGKVRTPSVAVYDAKGTKLVKNTDYTVTYASGRKNVGAYKVTIKGKGDYSFTKTLTFKILPVKTAIRNLEGRDKGFFARWNKKTEQVTGYQLQYSLKRSFDSAKTKTIGKNTTLSTAISKLKADKIYYVRVRTYKTVGNAKFYSAWSDPVRVRTQ